MVIFRPENDEVIWSNDLFLRITGEREHLFDTKITSAVPGFDTRWLMEGKTECPSTVMIDDRKFTVFGHMARTKSGRSSASIIATTYWVDVTEDLALKDLYYGSRPVVAILTIDNYDDLCRGLNDNARSALRSAVDEQIELWTKPTNGLVLRYDRDRYLFIFEEQYLTALQEAKFALLDAVRKINSTNGLPASMSIGIGMDTDFAELLQFASLATEMALSRGGDQAVIKNRFNFEFYGGRTKELEKRTKVKSRVMANALGELISSASTVYTMGHKFTDLDSIGACAGIVAAARKNGVRARIVIEPGSNPSTIMVNRLRQLPEYKDVFITADTAMLEADNRSLLVVVDTNRPDQVVAEQLLLSCNKVAVIDHHRRSAKYIENAALNYHEPYASSASELVTELLQYRLDPTDLMRRRRRPCWPESCWTPRTSPCAPAAAPLKRRPSCAGPGRTPPRSSVCSRTICPTPSQSSTSSPTPAPTKTALSSPLSTTLWAGSPPPRRRTSCSTWRAPPPVSSSSRTTRAESISPAAPSATSTCRSSSSRWAAAATRRRRRLRSPTATWTRCSSSC